MKNVIIGREILDIYDKYDHDFGLLDERWASERDRQKVTLEQSMLFSEYVEKLQLIKHNAISLDMKENVLKRIAEIEKVMDDVVVEILRKRVLGT
jgi:hypothetical protein